MNNNWRVMLHGNNKQCETCINLGLGEEIANCVTHGVMAFLCLCSLPVAAVFSYETSGLVKMCCNLHLHSLSFFDVSCFNIVSLYALWNKS